MPKYHKTTFVSVLFVLLATLSCALSLDALQKVRETTKIYKHYENAFFDNLHSYVQRHSSVCHRPVTTTQFKKRGKSRGCRIKVGSTTYQLFPNPFIQNAADTRMMNKQNTAMVFNLTKLWAQYDFEQGHQLPYPTNTIAKFWRVATNMMISVIKQDDLIDNRREKLKALYRILSILARAAFYRRKAGLQFMELHPEEPQLSHIYPYNILVQRINYIKQLLDSQLSITQRFGYLYRVKLPDRTLKVGEWMQLVDDFWNFQTISKRMQRRLRWNRSVRFWSRIYRRKKHFH